jgi:hypothetical protein
VGEREAEDEDEGGVREENLSGKEAWFVVSSRGATSAELEAANCASTINSCRQPASGNGNVSCAALGTEGKCCAISSPVAGP